MIMLGSWLLALSFSRPSKFQIISSAFEAGKAIPSKYARAGVIGGILSIPLRWTNAPPNTASFALSFTDLHPTANRWIHWLVTDIPASTGSIAEGASLRAMPEGSVELTNSFGERGYGGPQPPKGSGLHRYEITLHALDVPSLDLAASGGFLQSIEGHILATCKTSGHTSDNSLYCFQQASLP